MPTIEQIRAIQQENFAEDVEIPYVGGLASMMSNLNISLKEFRARMVVLRRMMTSDQAKLARGALSGGGPAGGKGSQKDAGGRRKRATRRMTKARRGALARVSQPQGSARPPGGAEDPRSAMP